MNSSTSVPAQLQLFNAESHQDEDNHELVTFTFQETCCADGCNNKATTFRYVVSETGSDRLASLCEHHPDGFNCSEELPEISLIE